MSDPADPPQEVVGSTEVDDTSRVNESPVPPPSQRMSGAAIAGVVFGLLGLVIPLVFLPAIVCGRMAQDRIRLAKGNLTGARLASAGVVLGYLGFVLFAAQMLGIWEPDGRAARMKAKLVSSRSSALALQTAVDSFYAEYGSLPDVGDRVTSDEPDGIRLLEILLGDEGATAESQCVRSLRFLNVRETNKRAGGGLLYRSDGRSVEGLFDAWGNPYVVELDADYDDRLRFKLGGKRVSLDARRVAVYSAGSDKKLGTDDDVKTW